MVLSFAGRFVGLSAVVIGVIDVDISSFSSREVDVLSLRGTDVKLSSLDTSKDDELSSSGKDVGLSSVVDGESDI